MLTVPALRALPRELRRLLRRGARDLQVPIANFLNLYAYTNADVDVRKKILTFCSYEVHTSAYDEASQSAIFFATFTATHSGEGGPVPPTNKTTTTHYVYVLNMNGDGKISSMTKIWNAPWAMRELGWL